MILQEYEPRSILNIHKHIAEGGFGTSIAHSHIWDVPMAVNTAIGGIQNS